jgi:predicted molibdopterin-dependent oxidoreductase YjgC
MMEGLVSGTVRGMYIFGENLANTEPDIRKKVESRRGQVRVRARVTPEVQPGMVWMAFHFREACANWLTNPAFDPETLTAEYKACAVRIKAE